MSNRMCRAILMTLMIYPILPWPLQQHRHCAPLTELIKLLRTKDRILCISRVLSLTGLSERSLWLVSFATYSPDVVSLPLSSTRRLTRIDWECRSINKVYESVIWQRKFLVDTLKCVDWYATHTIVWSNWRLRKLKSSDWCWVIMCLRISSGAWEEVTGLRWKCARDIIDDRTEMAIYKRHQRWQDWNGNIQETSKVTGLKWQYTRDIRGDRTEMAIYKRHQRWRDWNGNIQETSEVAGLKWQYTRDIKGDGTEMAMYKRHQRWQDWNGNIQDTSEVAGLKWQYTRDIRGGRTEMAIYKRHQRWQDWNGNIQETSKVTGLKWQCTRDIRGDGTEVAMYKRHQRWQDWKWQCTRDIRGDRTEMTMYKRHQRRAGLKWKCTRDIRGDRTEMETRDIRGDRTEMEMYKRHQRRAGLKWKCTRVIDIVNMPTDVVNFTDFCVILFCAYYQSFQENCNNFV